MGFQGSGTQFQQRSPLFYEWANTSRTSGKHARSKISNRNELEQRDLYGRPYL